VQKQIADTIEQQPRVTNLIHLRTEHIGPDELLVAAKVEFSSDLTLQKLADVVNEVETAIRRNVPEALVIYLEPDVTRMASKAIVTE
jgi:divalent metal cation (Fe/Co/Zn/Cd) transporter